jgi:hypothetical protein
VAHAADAQRRLRLVVVGRRRVEEGVGADADARQRGRVAAGEEVVFPHADVGVRLAAGEELGQVGHGGPAEDVDQASLAGFSWRGVLAEDQRVPCLVPLFAQQPWGDVSVVQVRTELDVENGGNAVC